MYKLQWYMEQHWLRWYLDQRQDCAVGETYKKLYEDLDGILYGDIYHPSIVYSNKQILNTVFGFGMTHIVKEFMLR